MLKIYFYKFVDISDVALKSTYFSQKPKLTDGSFPDVSGYQVFEGRWMIDIDDCGDSYPCEIDEIHCYIFGTQMLYARIVSSREDKEFIGTFEGWPFYRAD